MAGPKLKIDLIAQSPEALRLLMSALEEFGAFVRIYADVEELLQASGRSKAPVIVDLGSRNNGLDPVEKRLLLRRRTILTAPSATIQMAVDAMRDGAAFFLEQPICPEQLALALAASSACDGQDPSTLMTGLSQREREVLEGVFLGESSKAAGRRLGISYRTVECHRARLRSKLGAHNLPALIGLFFGPGVPAGMAA